MKDIVTFETAVRLKEAGFEQPTPEAGQFWYAPFMGKINERFPLYFIVRASPNIRFLSHEVNENESGHIGKLTHDSFLKACTFAPTATDILRELPDKTALYRVNKDMFLCWVRKDRALMMGDGPCMVNAAEAAAEAWIEWKEQTTTI